MPSVVLRILGGSGDPLSLSAPPLDLARRLAADLGVEEPVDGGPLGDVLEDEDLGDLISALREVDGALDALLDEEGEPTTGAGRGRNYFNRRQQLRAALALLERARTAGCPVEVAF